MKSRFLLFLRSCLFISLLLGMVFQPQSLVQAASSLTVTPITWNVVGLDSNDVNTGPNNFPVGVRACNPAASTTSVNNVSADFVWTSTNANINIRPGSLDPITTTVTLDPGECYDFYFEVTITRTTAAWNTARGYRIDVSGTDSGTAALVTASSPTPREIYVEKLVSQNRNSVTNILLDGVSIPAGGTMNLNIGQTYTIQLVGATATQGYEQIESFINFPNTIFQVNSVTATYTANAGTDPNAATKLYADGCGWVNDPTDVTTPAYRDCTGTGKYGGDITVTYNVTIIATGASSGTINTLIYDFSGSSYHYNSDYSTSSRIYNIIDPNSCALASSSVITQWTFTGNTTTASTNPGPTGGLFAPGAGLIFVPYATNASYAAGANPPLSYEDWTSSATFVATDYLEFSVPTVGYNGIWFTFYAWTSNNGFESADLKYSTDGINFTNFVSWTDLSTTWQQKSVDLTSITALNNQTSRVYFRLYGYSSGNANRDLSVDDVTIRGCQIPSSVSLSKTGSPAYFTAAGQTINYTYTLTNTGQTTLYPPYAVTDNTTTVTCPAVPASLAFGDTVTCTASYVTTGTDVANLGIANLAAATAQANYGGTLTAVTSNQAAETVELAALTVAKQVSTSASGPWGESITVNVGDTIFFQITVDNTGNADLNSVTVDDGMAACTLAAPTGDTDADNILDATETWVYTCSITAVVGSNITNTATADSTETTPVTDTASYSGQQPDLTVTKTNNVSGSIPLSGSFTWTITVSNGGTGSAVFADGQTLLSDPLPAAATYGAPSAGNFTNITNSANISCTITAGALACSASGASVTIGAGGSFTVTFTVTPTSAGTLSNTVTVDPNNNVTEGSEANNTGSDTVSVIAPPSIAKSFDDATIPLNGTTSLSFTISNPNAGAALTGVAFTDTLPAGLTIADSSTSQCGGTLTTTAATGVISLSGGSIAAGGSCTFSVTVTGSTAGVKNNTTGDVTSTNGGTGNTASASTTVVAPPSISKNFSPDPIFLNGTTTLTFTITNPNTGTALAGVAFTDPLPAGLQVAATPNASTSAGCGSPAFAPGATDTVLTFSGGTIPASGTCTVTVDVTATTGGLKNNTTGNVTSTNGSAGNTANDTLTVNTPSFSVGKVADVASVDAAGDVITYTVILTNTGNILLTDVSVNDPLLANLDCDGVVGAPFTTTGLTIAVNGTLTCTGTYTVTQADVDTNGGGDGDLDNTVTGDTNETGLQTASAVVTVTQTPAHTTAKTETSTGPYAVGNTITYNIVVTNTGNVTLTGVTVTDNNATLGICTPIQPSTLAPTATMTCSASHVVTQADVDSGSYVNTATGDSDQTTPNTDTVTVTFTQAPAHTTVKTETSSGPYSVSETISYNIVVTNTGNVTLTGVTVTDNSAVVGTCIPAQPATLAPNATMTCSASHVVTQADVDSGSFVNTAIGDSDQTTPNTGTVTVNFTQTPSFTIAKNANVFQVDAAGDIITYTVTMTNTGNITLTGVSASDPMLANLDCDGVVGAPFTTTGLTIAVNGTLTCTGTYIVTQADLDTNGGGDGLINNTVIGDTNETGSQTASEIVEIVQTPSHTTVKTEASAGPYVVGDTITYNIVVTNTGNITLTGVAVSDSSATIGTCTPAQPSTLAPGATMICPANHVVSVTDINNGSYVNTATGDTDQTTPNTSTVTVNFAQTPAHATVKAETSTGPYAVGDTITYDIVVTNTGNVTLTGVTVSDNSATVGACTPAQPSILAPNATMTCPASHVVMQADVDSGSYVNTATGDTDQTTPSTSTVTVNFAQNPAHTTVKTETSTGPYAIGDTITYNIVVTNTGNITLTGATVTDTSATIGTCTPGQPATLAPNATMTCPASHVVTQADVDSGSYVNTATGDSDQTTPNTSTVTVTFTQNPALNIVKEVSTDNSTWNDISVTVAVGDAVYYRVRVANTGNVTLTGLTVNDNRCTLTRGTDITGDNDNDFEVGEEWAYVCSVTAVLGTVNNTATADTNETPQDNDSASYTATAALTADPALSKAGSPTQASVGETVTFTVTVTNAGNAPAPNVVITDPLPAMFDVTAVTVTGAPFGTSVNVTPPIGTGPAPYTVVVTLGGNLGVTDVVTIEIVTTVNSLGNPPINNAASLTTTAAGDVTSNNSDSVTITLRSTSTALNQPRLLPATGFAPNVATVLPPQPQGLTYMATDVVLEIPGLGVKIPIVGVPRKNGTWDVSWLGNQAGWLEGSAFPSWKGNSALTSHAYLSNGLPGPFVDLGKLKFGDQIIVHAYGQKYIFEVQTNEVVSPTDVSAFRHEEKPWLTLITCKEYDEKAKSYRRRVVVRAILVQVSWDR